MAITSNGPYQTGVYQTIAQKMKTKFPHQPVSGHCDAM